MVKKFGEEVIENYEIRKVGWKWKFDEEIKEKYGILYRGSCLDGMVGKYVVKEEKGNDLK